MVIIIMDADFVCKKCIQWNKNINNLLTPKAYFDARDRFYIISRHPPQQLLYVMAVIFT